VFGTIHITLYRFVSEAFDPATSSCYAPRAGSNGSCTLAGNVN
jgi:hypothetical protein